MSIYAHIYVKFITFDFKSNILFNMFDLESKI